MRRIARLWLDSLLIRTLVLLVLVFLPLYGLGAMLNYEASAALLRKQIQDQYRNWVDTQRLPILGSLSKELDRLTDLSKNAALIQELAALPRSVDRAAEARRWSQASAEDPFRAAYVANPVGQLLTSYQTRFPYRRVVLVTDPAGYLLGTSTPAWPIGDLSRETWWADLGLIDASKLWVDRPRLLPGIAEPLLLLGVAIMPLGADGRQTQSPLGLLLVGVDANALINQRLGYDLPIGAQSWLVAPDGSVLATSYGQSIPGNHIPDSWHAASVSPVPVVDELASNIQEQPDPTLRAAMGLNQADYLETDPGVLQEINSLRWGLVLAAPQAIAYAGLTEPLTSLGIGMAVLLIALLGVVMIIFRGILIRPLDRLARVMDVAIRGDFSVRIPVPNRTEIGRVTEQFNLLAGVVQTSLERIAAHERRQDAIRSALQHAASTLSADAQKQATIAVQYASAMSQMLNTISELGQTAAAIASYADHVASDARTLLEQQQLGERTVIQAHDTFALLHQETTEVTQAVTALVTDSQDIRRVINDVSEIADQTHLLALNASIESASAGARGARFEVIAHEVRELAVEAGTAANAIQDTAVRIQDRIGDVVTRTAHELQVVGVGVEIGDALNNLIQHLLAAAERLAKTSDQIRDSTEQQRTASAVATQTLHDLTSASQDLATSSNSVLEAIGRLESLVLQLSTSPLEPIMHPDSDDGELTELSKVLLADPVEGRSIHGTH